MQNTMLDTIEKKNTGLHPLRSLHINKGNIQVQLCLNLCIYQFKVVKTLGYSEKENIFPFPPSGLYPFHQNLHYSTLSASQHFSGCILIVCLTCSDGPGQSRPLFLPLRIWEVLEYSIIQ